MPNKGVKLKIEGCFKVFQQSFNRVGYFSCINENLNLDFLPNDWIIKDQKGFGKAVQPPRDKQKESLLHGYKHFMQCYLVRDCIESFAVSLDNLFFNLLLNGKRIESNTKISELGNCLDEEEQKSLKQFSHAGLTGKKGKVELLSKHFKLDLSENYKNIVTSLKDIRNCLSHNNGFVRELDGEESENEQRKFRWKTFYIFGIESTGDEVDIEINKRLEADTTIFMRLQDHEKNHKVDSQLSFTGYETYEIAFSLLLVSKQYLTEINKLLNKSIK